MMIVTANGRSNEILAQDYHTFIPIRLLCIIFYTRRPHFRVSSTIATVFFFYRKIASTHVIVLPTSAFIAETFYNSIIGKLRTIYNIIKHNTRVVYDIIIY